MKEPEAMRLRGRIRCCLTAPPIMPPSASLDVLHDAAPGLAGTASANDSGDPVITAGEAAHCSIDGVDFSISSAVGMSRPRAASAAPSARRAIGLAHQQACLELRLCAAHFPALGRFAAALSNSVATTSISVSMVCGPVAA